ncbi:MAG: OmpA family protein [Desulfovibrionaceae bacterium]|nr:OmpA family protein [Desulfovibrionaceae bacterium]
MAIKRYLILGVFFFALVLVGCADDSSVEVTPEPAPQEDMMDPGMDDTSMEIETTEETVEPVIIEEVVTEEISDSNGPLSPEDQAILERRVYFGFDKYSLSPEAQAILREKLAVFERNPNLRVQLKGYCDDRGTQEYNLALGERRALAVYNFLVQNGVPSNRLETISYGKLFPAVEGSNPQAWSLNRRVEFESLGEGQ